MVLWLQLAAKSAPSRQQFTSNLADDTVSADDLKSDAFAHALKRDMQQYIRDSDPILQVINEFYQRHKLQVNAADV